MTEFNPLRADMTDARVRTYHLLTGGHPSRFGPDDISVVFYDVPKRHVWGTEVFHEFFKVHRFRGTHADVAKAFTIEVSEGGEPVAKAGAAAFRDGKIVSNGKRLVADARR